MIFGIKLLYKIIYNFTRGHSLLYTTYIGFAYYHIKDHEKMYKKWRRDHSLVYLKKDIKRILYRVVAAGDGMVGYGWYIRRTGKKLLLWSSKFQLERH